MKSKFEKAIAEALARYSNSRGRTLRKLTGVRLSPSDARRAWPRVLEHKWYVSERLGRDVGLRVAALDYFENIQRPLPPVPYRPERDALPPRLPMMMSFGERP